MICRAYQSVFSSDVFAITTSRRIPSTSCAYQSGKVSLSPTVTSTPYGSTEFSRSAATFRVVVCPARGAEEKLPTSGTAASSATGEAINQLRVGATEGAPFAAGFAEATSSATTCQTYIRPSEAHTPH